MLKIQLADRNCQIESIIDECREEKEVMLYFFTKYIEKFDVRDHWSNDFYLLRDTDNFVGFFQLKFQRKPNNVEINLLIKKDWRNKGYGKEALKLAMDKVFNFYGFHRLMAKIYSPNVVSVKLFSKYMKKEATLREVQILDGRYCDTLIYGLLKREYEQLKDEGEEDFIFPTQTTPTKWR